MIYCGLYIRISKELHSKFKMVCAANNKSFITVLTELIIKWISENE